MSAEHRADLLANDLLSRGMVPILTHEARAVIASAIREAQASARNEALEEAARQCDRYASVTQSPSLPNAIASAIRNLKTKD